MKKLILKLLVALALHRNRYYKYGSWQKSGMAGVILFSATGNSSVRSLFHRTSIFNSP